LADRVIVVIAPLIMGRGLESVTDLKIRNIRDSVSFSSFKLCNCGRDLILDGLIRK